MLHYMQSNFGVDHLELWAIVALIYSTIASIIDNKMFIKLFNVQPKKKSLIIGIVAEAALRLVAVFVFIRPYHRLAYMLISIFIFKLMYKQSREITLLGEAIITVSIIVVEAIFAKVVCLLFVNINSYAEGMYDVGYETVLSTAICLMRAIILFIVDKKKIVLNMPCYMSTERKRSTNMVSIVGMILIYCNSVKLYLYIKEFPYPIFLTEICLIILAFYSSIRSILGYNRLAGMNEKCNVLESYNKTLSHMYDNIRGFRHDFNNFVQVLNGYAEVGDTDGIKEMTSKLLKECKDVNSMGILNPKVVNNPAVYSILTNKYYSAQEQGIQMNIEVMMDFNEVKINTFEFSRILGILLDNAIEAAIESEKKQINIRFCKDCKVNRHLVVIENSFKELRNRN